MLKKEVRDQVYNKYLYRLYSGCYLTKARKMLISESGARQFLNRLTSDGHILKTVSDSGKKYIVFSESGLNFLKSCGVINEI